MTYDLPPARWSSLGGKMVLGTFLLIVGGLVNQWWNIPVQQMHQDDRLNSIERHMEFSDTRLDELKRQHDIMERQLEDLKRMYAANARKKG